MKTNPNTLFLYADVPDHSEVHLRGGNFDCAVGLADGRPPRVQLHVKSGKFCFWDFKKILKFFRAFAWSAHDQDELHSENGYITVSGGRVMLTTVMNNGPLGLHGVEQFGFSRA